MSRAILPVCVSAWAFASCFCFSEDIRVDLPPKTRLLEQVLVAKSPDSGATYGGMWLSRTQRNYEQVRFNVEPGDPVRGSRWVAYDTGQQKIVDLIDDVNRLCGRERRAGVLGQRIYASKQQDCMMGTGPAPTGPGKGYPGAHILRRGRDLGCVGPGWAVVAFEPQWRGSTWFEGKKHPSCHLALARSADGKKYRIYGALEDRITSLGIEGGAELRGFRAQRAELYFRAPGGQVMRKPLDRDDAAQPVEGDLQSSLDLRNSPDYAPLYRTNPGRGAPRFGLLTRRGDLLKFDQSLDLLGRHEGVLQGISPDCVDQWPWISGWLSRLEGVTVGLANLQEGYVCFARDAQKRGESARLFIFRPPVGRPEDLGPLAKFEGQALSKVHKLRSFGSGKVVVLAGNEELTALQIYEGPVIDSLCEQVRAQTSKILRAEPEPPAVTVRTIDNLYRFSEQADRGFDGMTVASDGKVYIVTMPHHPTKGAPMYVYDPATDRVELLGEFDELAGSKGPGRIPSMMHADPYELNGKLYLTGQDPFYGKYRFPGMVAEFPGGAAAEFNYVGSPLLSYDLKTKEFRNLGIPLPRIPGERESLFYVTGDPAKRILYLGYNYSKRTWYSLQLGEDGRPVGKPSELPLGGQPHIVHVGPDGKLYYPLLADEARPDQTGKKEKGKAARPRCEIFKFSPASGVRETIASFDVEELHGEKLPGAYGKVSNHCDWVPGQGGMSELVAQVPSARMLIHVDLRTGAVRKVCLWFTDTEKPVNGRGGRFFRHGDRVYWFNWKLGSGFLNSQLRIADLKTGNVSVYGRLVDKDGRTFRQVTQAATDKDGRVYLGGSMFGLPSDRHYCRRDIFAPLKVITGFCTLEGLPPSGKP